MCGGGGGGGSYVLEVKYLEFYLFFYVLVCSLIKIHIFLLRVKYHDTKTWFSIVLLIKGNTLKSLKLC